VSLSFAADSTEDSVTLSVASESASAMPSFVGASDRGDLPVIVNRAQAYYWTRSWLEGEAESLREIQDGHAVRFSDADAALRWLLSADS